MGLLYRTNGSNNRNKIWWSSKNSYSLEIPAKATARYVDTDGNKISDEVVQSGKVGDDYTTEQKDIDGYTFKEIQGSATGQFKEQAQTVTYQ